jgi:hypothetical protein
MNPLKLTEEIAGAIKAHVKSLDLKAIEKIRKASDKNGTFDVIISTEDIDRAGEIVRQDGWDFTNYKNNPIVLWGHDYYSLPIGVCTETYKTEVHGVPATGARGVFYPEDINPLAQQVRRMYDYGIKTGLGVGCTTSVGFIPKDFETDNRSVITKAELLEFSFVPVPANQGVGPAEGRALTFDEAKELNLDVVGLSRKGLAFVEAEKKDEEAEDQKGAQAGDDCTMDDGTPGKLTSDPDDDDGALVCIPNTEDKGAARVSQKKLLNALKDEHTRHTGEIEQAFDDFVTAAAAQPQTDEDKKGKKPTKETIMRDALKDLRDSMRDEHVMHRAKAIACFKTFDPSEDKAFDKREHLKALRGQSEEYETKCTKAVDEFEEKCIKSVATDMDDRIDAVAAKMDDAQRAHLKAVTKCAKAMCKDAFGEEDQADEKTLEILKEHLSAFVPEQMQTAVFLKVGARISAASKEKLGEAHQHMKAASAIVEALHGALGNDDGEEGRSEGDEKSEPSPAPRTQRSRPTENIQKDELTAHLLAKDILRGITTSAQKGLETLNKRAK